MAALGDELRFVLITSQARMRPAAERPATAVAAESLAKEGAWLSVAVDPAPKCARCWHRRAGRRPGPEAPGDLRPLRHESRRPGRGEALRMTQTFFHEKTALVWVWLSVFVVALDQSTKWYVVARFELYEILPVGTYLDLTRLHNAGAAFSLLADAGGWQRWFFLVLAGAIALAILWWLRSLPARGHSWLAIALALILGGALGNAYRPLHGRPRHRLHPFPLGRALLPGVQRRGHRHHDRGDHADDRRAALEPAEQGSRGMKILLANPRGFCAGVDRAIDIVERAIELFGAPIYVRHEVVHNKFVVDRLRDLGAVFVDELDEVPDGATVIFSAHGVPTAVRDEAARRGLPCSTRPARSSPRCTWRSASTRATAAT